MQCVVRCGANGVRVRVRVRVRGPLCMVLCDQRQSDNPVKFGKRMLAEKRLSSGSRMSEQLGKLFKFWCG
jgi:hypothetical protein